MKAVKDFDHLGVKYESGQVISPSAFTPDDLRGLIAKGLIKEEKLDAEKPEKKFRRSKPK